MSKIKQLIDIDNQDDDDFSRGPGDPDTHGYPGQEVIDQMDGIPTKVFMPAAPPSDIERGPVGDCFDWCALQAAKSYGKYIYCEGIAKAPDGSRWILHAWLTDKQGINAYDPTWRAFTNDGVDPPVPSKYIGRAIPIKDVKDWLESTGYKSIIANQWRNQKLANRILGKASIKMPIGHADVPF